MSDQTYAHPLYSFELIAHDAAGAAQARYAVPVPEGRLVISPALVARGVRPTCDACIEAVSAGLGYHAQDPAGFGSYGLGPEWAESMVYWQGRLRETDHALLQ